MERSAIRFSLSRRVLPSCLVITLASCGSVSHAQNKPLLKLEAQYEAENDPVRRAKLLAKLAPLDVDEIGQDLQADRDDEAFKLLQQFHDEVHGTTDALSAMHVDASRRPAGFKELQIGLRESLRRLRDVADQVPTEQEEHFEKLRSDIVAAQNSLIDALFPSEKTTKGDKAD